MSFWEDPATTAILGGGYLGLMSLMWGGLTLGVPAWGARWRVERPATPIPAEGRRLSVIIPARNEAANIGAAVRSALAIHWPDLEVIVVDDRSEDDTAALALAAGAGDPRLDVITAPDRPQGWAGKVWAAHCGSLRATGALLLFLDADVEIDPDAAPALIGAMDESKAGLGSCFGSWRLVSFWERALIPTVGWFIRGAVDLDAINDPGRPEAFANGQLLCARREAYLDAGGHEAIAGQILDDVRLAERMKRRGVGVALRVMPWAFSVRLYRSLDEIWRGYSKNLYEGMGRRPLIGLGAVLFIFVGTLFPHVLLAGGLIARLVLDWGVPTAPWLLWIFLLCGLQVAFRARVELRDGRSPTIAWVHPLANLLLVGILLRSVFGVEATWKGRRFVDGKAT